MTTLHPPPRKSPLPRRERGHGKLVLWAHGSKANRLAGVFVPYGHDEKGRPLWKFVLRKDGRSKVIPARDWKHANNESFKLLGRWDDIVKDKASRRSTLVVATRALSGGWRWTDLVREFLDHKATQGRALPSTVAGYGTKIKRYLTPFFDVKLGDPAIADIDPDVILDCRVHVTGKAGEKRRASWNKLFTLMTQMFKYAQERRKLAANPCAPGLHRFPPKSKDGGAEDTGTAITGAELDVILEVADCVDDPRLAVAVLLAGYGGLRLDELLHVRLDDLTITDTLIDVRVASGFPCTCPSCVRDGGTHRTKNGTTRHVPLLPEHGERLAAHVARLAAADLTDKNAWLLATLRRQPRSKARPGDMAKSGTVATHVKAIVEKALGHKLSSGERVHLLRKAARTRLSNLAMPPETIDLILGHRLPGMRHTYTHQDRVVAFRMLCERAGRPLPPAVTLVRSA